jgi:acetylornithine deacetylase/succinyl-diaminopimelate desuccinylase-like protein
LDVLAVSPRPAGGAAEAAARARCAEYLAGLGFSVSETAFAYSSAPGRFATPGFGIVWIAVIAAAGHIGTHWSHWWAAALLAAVGASLLVAARLITREGVLSLPVAMARGINLVATRGIAPKVWLVAHLDSKSQPIPILVRALGIAGCALIYWVALVVAVAGWRQPWVWVTAAGIMAGLPVALSWVGNRSPGALDNASGVATVMLAAGRIPRGVPVGIVLTSAEELGLAGARAFFRALRPPIDGGGVVLNCDGVDDSGYLTVMYSGVSRPERVIRVFGGAARPGPLPPGVLVDAVACREEGWDAVTLSRGTPASWLRVHSARDTADRLTGAGIDSTATVLAAAAQALA